MEKALLFLSFSPHIHVYSDIRGLREYGYGAIPRFEQTLASYLSPGSVSTLKASASLTKPLKKTIFNLVGKAFTAVGLAGACLHTIAVLQAYQADLLWYLDRSEGVWPDGV
jgi:hypothetical protein